eukprot:TRINITY_DN913_c0_g1_i4.p1 TRINITY_DN913_c0_g1~~TRINITY_DN913_c0_g1_i4.p1  ORF type:complete len:195 (+),score=35.03 TRINITY_DN913_c0_g1_i4:594-1178(+)
MKKNVLLKKQWYQRRVRGAQMEVQLSKEGNIFILRINDGKDNRTTLDLLHQLDGVLDEVEQSVGPAALVTIGSPKFYSNGIPTEGTTPEILAQISLKLYACLARLVVFPIPTVAIVTGHAVGGGAMLALAHDFRSTFFFITRYSFCSVVSFLLLRTETQQLVFLYSSLSREYTKLLFFPSSYEQRKRLVLLSCS